jgi:PAS domain-containing protein
MGQQAIEVILMRRLASYLAVPIVVVDPKGDLLFFNDSAEPLVGRPFGEIEAIRRGEWSSRFHPTWEDGTPVPREEQPLFVATERREPVHCRYWVEGLDGIRREIEGIGFPLIGQSDRMLGAVGVFWDVSNPRVPSDAPSPAAGDGAPRRPIEVILVKQLASYLAIPMLLIGPEGHLLFFNESAEPLLGARFDELDAVPLEEWSNALQSADEDGSPIKQEDRPMVVALRKREPRHRRFFIRGFDGIVRKVEGIAFPLLGRRSGELGALGIFWGIEP